MLRASSKKSSLVFKKIVPRLNWKSAQRPMCTFKIQCSSCSLPSILLPSLLFYSKSWNIFLNNAAILFALDKLTAYKLINKKEISSLCLWVKVPHLHLVHCSTVCHEEPYKVRLVKFTAFPASSTISTCTAITLHNGQVKEFSYGLFRVKTMISLWGMP